MIGLTYKEALKLLVEGKPVRVEYFYNEVWIYKLNPNGSLIKRYEGSRTIELAVSFPCDCGYSLGKW